MLYTLFRSFLNFRSMSYAFDQLRNFSFSVASVSLGDRDRVNVEFPGLARFDEKLTRNGKLG